MCGIGGYVLRTQAPVVLRTLDRFLGALRPRGPDDEGVTLIGRAGDEVWHCRTGRTAAAIAPQLEPLGAAEGTLHDVALVNARFAIADRRSAAHQPFTSRCRSVVACFHGEIYNYHELGRALEAAGVSLRTTGDTEVLVEGYRLWGDVLWDRLNGFWAAVLYDRRDRRVVVSRDRLGVAPLYTRETARGFFFASTIAPLIAADPAPVHPDEDVLAGFIETELKDVDEATCFRGITTFPAGSTLTLPHGAVSPSGRYRRFWTVPTAPLSPRGLALSDAVSQFRDLLHDAVTLRLRTDMPLACELSGGLDSSSVVAMAAELRPGLAAYTVRVPGHDEEPYARALAKRFGLDYRVLEVEDARFTEEADGFAATMEEPYHAPNVYMHYRLRAAMKDDGVGVALTGSGGDEVLAGYEWDFWPQARRDILRRGHVLHAVRCHVAMRFGTVRRAWTSVRDPVRWWAARLRSLGAPAPSAGGRVPRAVALQRAYPELPFQEQRLFHLTTAQLPYYLLSDDRFSMTLPLEHRLPFLDYRLVEFAMRLPAEYLFRDGWTKYVLRRAMEPLLPATVVWRREKMGFPFALQPFLTRHRTRLESALGTAVAHGFAPADSTFRGLAARTPLRLWRLCSTGLWLDALPRLGAQTALANASRRAT